MSEEDVSINLANTIITVAGAGLEECNGEYVVTDISYRHDKPKWCNTKTIAIGIDGNQVVASSTTGTTAPNNKFVHHEVTVLNSGTPKTMAFGFCMMTQDDTSAGLTNTLDIDWNQKITVSVDVNAATATTDVKVYALQVVPLK